MWDKLSEKWLKYIFVFGCFSHGLNYYLDGMTLRNGEWSLCFVLISTILGSIYFINNMELFKDSSYINLKGIKLKLYKIFFTIAIIFGCSIMFGGYLDSIMLGTNYLFRENQKSTQEYQILNVQSFKLGRRTERRVPLITISDGEVTDKIKLTKFDFDEFDMKLKKMKIEYQEGFWHWKIITL